MKILSVTNYSPKNNSYYKSLNKQQQKQDSFTFNGYWSVDVLKKTDDEVLDMAKYFYKSSQKELEDVTAVRTPLLGIKRKYASLAAFYKMKCATDKINFEVQEIKTKLATLNQLCHINASEANEINLLNAKLTNYDVCFDKRYNKFYHEEEFLEEEPLDTFLNPFEITPDNNFLRK